MNDDQFKFAPPPTEEEKANRAAANCKVQRLEKELKKLEEERRQIICGVQPPADLAYLPCELAKGHPGGHTFEPFEPLSSLTAVERAQLKYRVVAEYRALELEKDGLKNDLAEITDLLKPLIEVISKWYGGLKGGNAIAVATQLLETMADKRNSPPAAPPPVDLRQTERHGRAFPL